MAKKRRKPLSEQWYTSGYIALQPQTVRMRLTGWTWQVRLGGRWFTVERSQVTDQGAHRSGNAWARRMGYTPEWE